MSTLVFLEHHEGAIQKGALGVLAKALALGGDVAGVVVGHDVGDIAASAGAFGATTVYVVDAPEFAAPLPQPRVDALEAVVTTSGAENVLFAASVLSADVAAGLSARLDAGLNWDLTDIRIEGGSLVGKRPALGDTVVVDVGWTSTPRLGLVRSGSFEPAETGGTATVETVAVTTQDFSTAARMVEQAHEQASGPSIEDADVIVAGGRGLGAPEGFKLAEDLAAALGGAVAATRAVVDAGWYPYATQVGQTGKSVSPKLYIALGISGAIQHKVGMQSSGTIVAINKDPNAPIFDFADFGIVGDLNQVVPKLAELVRARRVLAMAAEIRAADYPPPFSSDEVIAAPTDAPDERIDVGVLIVGGGPAGLACAVRLGQLLEDDPATAERLGEVPVALVDKGKQPGSHLLSGAVMNPRAVRRLFRGRQEQLDGIPTFGEVPGEGVYLLTSKKALRIPPPPTLRNHGNWIVSISQMSRYLAELAEASGTFVLPETSADRLLVQHGRVVGIRSGDKGRGKENEPLGNFEPGADIAARVTVLAEGTAGHLTGAALDHFGLNGPEPQIWELGVKEIWRVPKPLTKIIHTLGWPLRKPAKYREFGGSWLYPMGDDMISLGFVVGLDYRDVELSAHDLLQEFKTHPFISKILEGGERVAWGAKTITSGGWHAMPRSLGAPGLLLAGESAGLVDLARLKGVHYAIESGRLAAEAAYRSLQRGESPARIGVFDAYDDEVRTGYLGKGLYEVRNMRQAFEKGFYMGGALASAMTITRGKLPPKEYHNESNASSPLLRTDRASSYPAPDGKLTFDKLSSVFASGNRTRDDQPNHVRVERHVPREVAEMWSWMCPAQVYEVGDDIGDDLVELKLTPSNCVQCGAITARGGRLTPPEGGSGPEYTLT